MIRIHSLFLVILAFVLAACAGSFQKPTPMQHDWVKAHYGMAKDIDRGYKLFVSNCSGCHSLPHPSAYSDSAWAVVFPEMRQKSNLNDDEADLVLAYIASASWAAAHTKM